MITKSQRMLLCDVEAELGTAKYSLFKASILLEKVENSAFDKTINEIKKSISDLNDSSNGIVDFINEQDFPKSTL